MDRTITNPERELAQVEKETYEKIARNLARSQDSESAAKAIARETSNFTVWSPEEEIPGQLVLKSGPDDQMRYDAKTTMLFIVQLVPEYDTLEITETQDENGDEVVEFRALDLNY